ncbi:MAG: tetratricopeptide repeat protein [bacterium]|nr:tetratricopeptide repeat protein [bacterium]
MKPAASRQTWSERARSLWPVLLPVLATLLVYHGVGSYDFVNFDDDLYVYDNPRVTGGLSPANAQWAFTTGHAQVWIPVTWLSLQLDATLAGPGAAGFHRTNLFLHLAGVLLAWLLARRLTGSAAAAMLAAALFGVHPLNVEAVAWVTARKDVLMAPLLLGAALAWVSTTGRRRVVLTFALALLAMLAKPAAVVAPLLLLLLSLWERWSAPEGAASRRGWRGDAVFLAALAAAAAAVALVTVRLARDGEMGAPVPVAPVQRVADAATGVGRYLERLAWPHGLAVRYSEADLRAGPIEAVIWGVVVVALSFVLWRARRRLPLVTFGWAWFLACLLPSSGLLQGGQLPMGDRYAYVGALGLWIAGAGALVQVTARAARLKLPVLLATVAVVAAAAMVATRQAAVWRGPESLWRHALAVTRDNDVAHQNLAVLLDDAGRREEALQHLEASIAIKPRSETHFNAGNVTAALGRLDEAEVHYRAALKLNPSLGEASLNLGSLLGGQGRLAEARQVLLTAAERHPDLASVQYNLAVVAWMQGDAGEATLRCRRALELESAHAGSRQLLAQIASTPTAPPAAP